MVAFCTYCSKLKSLKRSKIPAICRYRSPRIERVYQAACGLRMPFFILSGRYGLLRPERCISLYDHLLKRDEVPAMAELVGRQIDEFVISGFVYFTRPLASDDNVVPYHDVLVSACRSSSCDFYCVQLEASYG